MSAMDIDNDASSVLASLRMQTESNELIQIIYELEDFYERKLWHQLTLALEEFYSFKDSSELKVKVYKLFISKLFSKLNKIKTIDFLLESFDKSQETLSNLLELREVYAKQIKANNSSKADDLEEIVENDESMIYINLQIARFQLILNDITKAEDILDKLNSKFNNSDFESQFNTKINAAFYLTKCQLYKINENYNAFYLSGLLYLSSVENNIPEEEATKICYDLCMAALLGDKIYNFGELILHDILNVIKDNEYNWLYNLIVNLNAGNLANFNKWLAVSITKSPFLGGFEVFLKQKIIIMSLMELISLKAVMTKQLTFQEISDFTGTSMNDVEHLIIKCFSLNLIKGYINQIDEILVVTWLQPRILDLTQVKNLYDHVNTWNSQVDSLAKEVYKNGGSIWAA